jgi:hypothetical protein
MAADKTLIEEINGNVRSPASGHEDPFRVTRLEHLGARPPYLPAPGNGCRDRRPARGSEFCQTKALERRPQAGQRQADRERQRRPAKSPRGGTGLRAERVGNTPGQKAQAPLGQPLATRPDSRTLGERARRKTPQGPAPERRVHARQARRQKISVTRGALPVAEAGIPLKLAARSCAVYRRQHGG